MSELLLLSTGFVSFSTDSVSGLKSDLDFETDLDFERFVLLRDLLLDRHLRRGERDLDLDLDRLFLLKITTDLDLVRLDLERLPLLTE